MKKMYDAPHTWSKDVELENGFMAGSEGGEIDDKEDLGDISIAEQAPGVAIGSGSSGSGFDDGKFGSGWDE